MGGGRAEGYYAGSLYTGIALVVVALSNIILYVLEGQSVSYQDALAIVTGIVGIAAGKVSNKGLLIAYMILGIICAIVFAIMIPAFGLVVSTCEAATALINTWCPQNDAGENYCCSACEQNACGGAGCEWGGSYTTAECVVPLGAPESADVPQPCDKDCCDEFNAVNPSIYWQFETREAKCGKGYDGQRFSSAHGQGTCETDSDVASQDQCIYNRFGKQYTNFDIDYGISGLTYANTGCHKTVDTGICEYKLFIWITIFVTLGLSIAGSVMGCCVVCCKNDQVGDDDDSG